MFVGRVCWLVCMSVCLSVCQSVCQQHNVKNGLLGYSMAPGSERKILLGFGSNHLHYISTIFAIWDSFLERHKKSEGQRCTARMHNNIAYLSSKAFTAITAVIKKNWFIYLPLLQLCFFGHATINFSNSHINLSKWNWFWWLKINHRKGQLSVQINIL